MMGAGRDAGQLADAALHKVGQRLGLGSPRTQRRVAPPTVPDSPPSTTGSSQDLDAAASLPLPGGWTIHCGMLQYIFWHLTQAGQHRSTDGGQGISRQRLTSGYIGCR